jgi:uncharacterized protein (TIGR00299 family) protein
MMVAALLDLGANQTILENAIKSLPLEGFEIKISRVKKSGLDVCDFAVLLDKKHENHDYDMQYLHGTHGDVLTEHTHHDDHEHVHDDEHEHNHEHHHEHRGLHEINEIISHTDITDQAKYLAKKIFLILAESEAKAHGTTLEGVHFHEVGAVDSIVDIVAVAVCLDNLAITEAVIPELYEGRGHIRCQHGVIPVPVPAVLNIVAAHGLQLHLTQTEGELVTPTGAAIVAAIQTKQKLPEHFKILKTGLGAGKRNYDRPSLLRAILIEASEKEGDSIWKLESNIDDTTGEAMGFVMDELLHAGARDVNYSPVYMKKNRPAYQLNIICDEADIATMEHIVFAHTTTIGIRRQKMERTILAREIRKIQTSFGEVRMKLCNANGEQQAYPEYEDVAAICRAKSLGFQSVYHQLIQEFLHQ